MGLSDKLVDSRDVLRAVMEVRRLGSGRVLRELETLEVDLAEFLMEELGNVHRQLLDLRVKPKVVRRLIRRVESLAVVLVTALRLAQLRLWRQDAANTPLAEIDPTLSEGTKSSDADDDQGQGCGPPSNDEP